MNELTERQREILEFINDFSNDNGMAPTTIEIAENFNIKTSGVFNHLLALQKKGYITKSSKARSIRLIGKAMKKKVNALLIPLLGRVNAGALADNLEYFEKDIACSVEFAKTEDASKLFALRVQGESMRDLGIYEGDIVVVRRDLSPRNGDIVIAIVDNETTIKTLKDCNDKIKLIPANPDFNVQVYDRDQVDIQGVLIGLQREYI